MSPAHQPPRPRALAAPAEWELLAAACNSADGAYPDTATVRQMNALAARGWLHVAPNGRLEVTAQGRLDYHRERSTDHRDPATRLAAAVAAVGAYVRQRAVKADTPDEINGVSAIPGEPMAVLLLSDVRTLLEHAGWQEPTAPVAAAPVAAAPVAAPPVNMQTRGEHLLAECAGVWVWAQRKAPGATGATYRLYVLPAEPSSQRTVIPTGEPQGYAGSREGVALVVPELAAAHGGGTRA